MFFEDIESSETAVGTVSDPCHSYEPSGQRFMKERRVYSRPFNARLSKFERKCQFHHQHMFFVDSVHACLKLDSGVFLIISLDLPRVKTGIWKAI